MPTGTMIDATDRKLLVLLQQDARRTVTALGKELHLSRTAVHARLARLEREGVVVSYSAILREPPDAGLSAIVSLRFGLRPCSLVLDQIKSWPEILHGYSTTGPIDAVLIVRVASSGGLSELADRLKTVVGIDTVETTLVLSNFVRGRA